MPRKTTTLTYASPRVDVLVPRRNGACPAPRLVFFSHGISIIGEPQHGCPLQLRMTDCRTGLFSKVFATFSRRGDRSFTVFDRDGCQIKFAATSKVVDAIWAWGGHTLFDRCEIQLHVWYDGDDSCPRGWHPARLVTDAEIILDKRLIEGVYRMQLQYNRDKGKRKYEDVAVETDGESIAIYCMYGTRDFVPSRRVCQYVEDDPACFPPAFPSPFKNPILPPPAAAAPATTDDSDESEFDVPAQPSPKRQRLTLPAPPPPPMSLYLENQTKDFTEGPDWTSPRRATTIQKQLYESAKAEYHSSRTLGSTVTPPASSSPLTRRNDAWYLMHSPPETNDLPDAGRRAISLSPQQTTPAQPLRGLGTRVGGPSTAPPPSTRPGLLGSFQTLPSADPRPSHLDDVVFDGTGRRRSDAAASTGPWANSAASTGALGTPIQGLMPPPPPVANPAVIVGQVTTGPNVSVPPASLAPSAPLPSSGNRSLLRGLEISVLRLVDGAKVSTKDLQGQSATNGHLCAANLPFVQGWSEITFNGYSLGDLRDAFLGTALEPVVRKSAAALFYKGSDYLDVSYDGALRDVTAVTVLRDVCRSEKAVWEKLNRGANCAGSMSDCFTFAAKACVGSTRGRSQSMAVRKTTYAMFITKCSGETLVEGSSGTTRTGQISGVFWADCELPDANGNPSGDPKFFEGLQCQFRKNGVRVPSFFIVERVDGLMESHVASHMDDSGMTWSLMRYAPTKNVPFAGKRHLANLVDVRERDVFSMFWLMDHFSWGYNADNHLAGYDGMMGDVVVTLSTVTVTRKMDRFKRQLKKLNA